MFFLLVRVKVHRVGKIFHWLNLIYRHIPRRSVDNGGNTVYQSSAGVIYGFRLLHEESGVRFAGNLPIAHIAFVGNSRLINHLANIVAVDALNSLYIQTMLPKLTFRSFCLNLGCLLSIPFQKAEVVYQHWIK